MTKAGHWLRKGREEGGPSFTQIEWGSLGGGKRRNLYKGGAEWASSERRKCETKKKGESERIRERQKGEALSLIEPYEKLCEWPLSVFPTQVIAETSSPLEKGACSWIDSEAHFSLTKKHSCLYWSTTGDSASRETKRGEKNEGDKGRLGEKMKEEKGQTRVGKWENLRKVTEKRKKKNCRHESTVIAFPQQGCFWSPLWGKKDSIVEVLNLVV